jgi:uncharacterized repeat protein (TIGR01451 family)
MTADPATVRVLRIVARVTQPGRIAMLATKTAAVEFDPVVGNDSSGDVLNEENELADVVVEKIATPASGAVGDVILTGIIAGNAGPGPATGIVVTDLPTPGLLPVGILPGFPTQGTYDEATMTWEVGDLAPQASAALGILAVITDPSPQGNTAQKTAQNEPDPNPLNDRDGAPVNNGTASEITVTKAVSSGRVRVGDQVTFTVKASNSSLGNPVTGIQLTDLLPPGLTFISATPSQGTFEPAGLVWTVGDLPSNGSAALAIRARVDQPGTFVNTATRTGGDQLEITPQNDSATATVIAGLGADLSVRKTIGLESAVPGLPATWTISVRNDGPSPLTGVTVSDPLPTVLLSATWTCAADTGATCAQQSGTGDIATSVDLPAGSEATFTVTGTVRPDALGTLGNTASATSPDGVDDPNPDDNTSTVEASLVPAADLSIVKTGPGIVAPGASVDYAFTVSNAGPSTALDVVVDDPSPAGLVFVSNAGDCTTSFPCALGTLEPGATRSIVATYTAVGDVGTAVLNTATVMSSTLDPTPDNAAGSVTTVVTTRTGTTEPPPPPPTTTTTTATTTTATPQTTTTISASTTTTAPPSAERCDNCIDDDGDGLIDAEDPDCCVPQPLTVTQTRFKPARATLRLNAMLPDDVFAGVDPRRDEIRLQIRDADGTLACCTIPSHDWQKLFHRTFGFFDQKMTVCPSVRCVKLVLPKKGAERATIILGHASASTARSPIEITMSAGNQCTQGQVSVRPRASGRTKIP